MYNLVIADTSCLIVLEKINQLELLQKLFSNISVTQEIQIEFGGELPEWITIKKVEDVKRQNILELDLDSGEASAIALALENEQVLLLIDEKKGRGIAKKLGLVVMGTLGVIIKAKDKQLIDSIRTQIDKLQEVNFRISERLVNQVIEKYEK